MIRKSQKPVERYIKYFSRRADNGRYQINIIYFIDKGNPITDIDLQYKKTLFCDERNLDAMKIKIQKKIDKTQECLEQAFYNIGASYKNILCLVNEKMR